MDIISNNQNFNSKPIGFENNIEEKTKMNNEDDRKTLLQFCSKKLAEQAEREVPQNGKFRNVGISFELKGTNNVAVVDISYNVDDPKNLRDLNFGVRHKNSDKLYNYFGITTGTKEEIINYLKNIDVNSNLGQIMELSDKVDESISNL